MRHGMNQNYNAEMPFDQEVAVWVLNSLELPELVHGDTAEDLIAQDELEFLLNGIPE